MMQYTCIYDSKKFSVSAAALGCCAMQSTVSVNGCKYMYLLVVCAGLLFFCGMKGECSPVSRSVAV